MPKTVNSKPLREALVQVRRAIDDIADSHKQHAALKEEVRAYLAKVDPRDEEAMKLIANRKLQSEIFPNFIERAEKRLREKLIPALVEKIEAVEREYHALRNAEHERALDRWEGILRPVAEPVTEHNGEVVNRARGFAQTLPAMNCFASRWPALPAQWQSHTAPADVIACAEAALALLADVERNGIASPGIFN